MGKVVDLQIVIVWTGPVACGPALFYWLGFSAYKYVAFGRTLQEGVVHYEKGKSL